MVTRLTNYTKQFWILLSTDDMDTLGSHNGDEAIVIDQDKRYVFDEENQTWRQIPMSGGGGGDVASGTSVAVNRSMVIPKVAGKSNFFACVDGDSAYINEGAALAAFRLAWLSATGVYSTKVTNPGITPPQVATIPHNAIYVTETVDSISIEFPNENTVGKLPNGTTVRYMWW